VNRSSIFKLNDRGWKQIEDGTAVHRDQRIDNLLSESPAIEYTSELPDGVYGGSWKNEDGLSIPGITSADIWNIL
jgi:hypothetical protein